MLYAKTIIVISCRDINCAHQRDTRGISRRPFALERDAWEGDEVHHELNSMCLQKVTCDAVEGQSETHFVSNWEMHSFASNAKKYHTAPSPTTVQESLERQMFSVACITHRVQSEREPIIKSHQLCTVKWNSRRMRQWTQVNNTFIKSLKVDYRWVRVSMLRIVVYCAYTDTFLSTQEVSHLKHFHDPLVQVCSKNIQSTVRGVPMNVLNFACLSATHLQNRVTHCESIKEETQRL